MSGDHVSPGQRLLAVFLVTILAPGLLLAIFGARALWQERRLAEQPLKDRLEQGSDLAARSLQENLSRVQAMVDHEMPPEAKLQDLSHDGSWAYIESRSGGLRVYPPGVLPYELSSPLSRPPDPALARSEQAAEAEQDPLRAAASYQKLLATARPEWAPEIKHRIARVLKEAGRKEEALRVWRGVEVGGGQIGPLPADLVAGFEIASSDPVKAAEFYRKLASGSWRLEKPRYLYYASSIREMLGEPEQDDPRLRLAEAVEAAATGPARVTAAGDSTYLAFRRDDPFAALVVTRAFLAARVWPQLPVLTDGDPALALITANGHEMLRMGRDHSSPLRATRLLEGAGIQWRIELQPANAAGYYTALNRTTRLYLALLAMVLALLASGGYFIVRTVRRELEVARMKSDFVSTVSHEFRSPLTGIRQLGEMLARGRVGEEHKRLQYYELIVRESDRLARLVENVLDFSRMEEGRKPYQFEPLNTAWWLAAVAEEFQREAVRSGHRLEASIPDGLPNVKGDREALSTALRNLLDNAVKYSPGSKTVWLEATAVNGGVTVKVRDHGVGIPARERQHIFEKFYRGGGELAKQVKGAGLGLSLVRHIVEAHEGEVVVESREGEGSTFTLHLAGTS